mgnify:FL=1
MPDGNVMIHEENGAVKSAAMSSQQLFNELLEDYFEGSVENVLSFMVKEKGLSEKDMEELQKLIDNMGNSSQP